MALYFTKMHGLGNDFVIVDATNQPVSLSATLIKKMADRQLGIGFDQLLLIEPSPSEEFDFIYRIFNADGQEVEQCGNGARCVGYYLFSEKLPAKERIILKAIAGKLVLKQEADGQITVDMGLPHFLPAKIPFVTEFQMPLYTLSLNAETIAFGAVSIGNPHVVINVTNIDTAQVERIGKSFQHHPAFPRQVNVGFMQIMRSDFIKLRVYERGVGETKSCGSGACAAVAIGRIAHQLAHQVKVEMPGGILTVTWPSFADNIFLTGLVERVFNGELVS